jgi:hypothetical protein
VMQTQQTEISLFDLLGQTIKQLERIEDDPKRLRSLPGGLVTSLNT